MALKGPKVPTEATHVFASSNHKVSICVIVVDITLKSVR